MLTLSLTIEGAVHPQTREQAEALVRTLLEQGLPEPISLLDWTVRDGKTGEELGTA